MPLWPLWVLAAPLTLPEGEDPAAWEGPAELRGFELEAGAEGPRAVLVDQGEVWLLRVWDDAGIEHQVRVAEPATGAEREDLLALAASLLEAPELAFELRPPDEPVVTVTRPPPTEPGPPPLAEVRPSDGPWASDHATPPSATPPGPRLPRPEAQTVRVHVSGSVAPRVDTAGLGRLSGGLRVGDTFAIALFMGAQRSTLASVPDFSLRELRVAPGVAWQGRRGLQAGASLGLSVRGWRVEDEAWARTWTPSAGAEVAWMSPLGRWELGPFVGVRLDLLPTELTRAGEPLQDWAPYQGEVGLRVARVWGDPSGRLSALRP